MSEQARTGVAPGAQRAGQSLALTIGAALIFLGGLTAAATGVWFIVGDHPFHRPGGYAEEFDMTKAEVDDFNPEISDWVMHVSDQVGSVSLGWGLFLMALAVFGIRRGERSAWWALWIGGLPTLLISAFGELIQFGTLDTGSILSIGVLLLFLIGMLLPVRSFLQGSPRA